MNTSKALLFIEDQLQRSMIDFVLIAKTAKEVVDDQVELSTPIKIGVLKQDWTQSGVSILKMLIPEAKFTEKKVTLEHEEVPIEIKIIHGKYKNLQNPDRVFYNVTEFNIPNPFKNYYLYR
ncbi:hypothetical protein LCGC14_1618020 [marine sediment metagenome]|uniref:Uncharacterized protein n=1 Tax=marine sediment metagenome TaxID=412755 RepID=A0A0F9I6B4_9ZZZZ